jgi:hypothetical protein
MRIAKQLSNSFKKIMKKITITVALLFALTSYSQTSLKTISSKKLSGLTWGGATVNFVQVANSKDSSDQYKYIELTYLDMQFQHIKDTDRIKLSSNDERDEFINDLQSMKLILESKEKAKSIIKKTNYHIICNGGNMAVIEISNNEMGSRTTFTSKGLSKLIEELNNIDINN